MPPPYPVVLFTGQPPLKSKAFSILLDKNLLFELRPEYRV
jgi:hypothetical protein